MYLLKPAHRNDFLFILSIREWKSQIEKPSIVTLSHKVRIAMFSSSHYKFFQVLWHTVPQLFFITVLTVLYLQFKYYNSIKNETWVDCTENCGSQIDGLVKLAWYTQNRATVVISTDIISVCYWWCSCWWSSQSLSYLCRIDCDYNSIDSIAWKNVGLKCFQILVNYPSLQMMFPMFPRS